MRTKTKQGWFSMLTESNAHELTQICQELGAQVLCGWLQYLGLGTDDCELD